MYERKHDDQVFSVLPVKSILRKLPVFPVGDTGTIPFSMWQNVGDLSAQPRRAKMARNEESHPPVLPILKR